MPSMRSRKQNQELILMYLKKHSSAGKEVLALCDENLLGKEFHEEGMKLEVSESFYKGEKVSKEEVIRELQKASNMNIVGEESIKTAEEAGIISKEQIKTIQGVPFTLIFEL